MMRCVCIFGPTASGKSSLALRLAEELNGVIISADSMQIYRRMNIGTAKPTEDELSQVPHKMIDIADLTDSFSVWDYKVMAEREIENTLNQGKLPIIVGGTGLYLDALFFNTNFGEFEIDPAVHQKLTVRAENGEGANLLEELRQIDPVCAAPLHEKDLKRIIRALEVYHSTGKTLTEFKAESHREKSRFSFLKFHLVYQDRSKLYDRIGQRVDEMIKCGLLQEIQELYADGLFCDTTASQAIGYKEFIPYLTGNETLENCTELLKQKTRNYAKRQITWFKRYEDAISIPMDEDPNPYETVKIHTLSYLKDGQI